MVRERESYFHFLKGYQKNLKKTLSIDKVVKNKNNFNVHVQIHQTFTFTVLTVHSRKKNFGIRHAHAKVPRTGEMLIIFRT